MIYFPVFKQLDVFNYGLYPGTSEKPGISIAFAPGLTLVLGANGLGKTTLITILFRMLCGPFDLPRATLEARELGGATLDVKPLNVKTKAALANRVQDVAAKATATLQLSLAGKQITIRRNLKDLSLISAKFDDTKLLRTESDYQAELSTLSGVPTFGDLLLLLRTMVFYFEDRRELVWDVSAQRHVLRMMFLPPEEAANWYMRERDILRRDSQYRNLTASLNRLEGRVEAIDKAVGDEASLLTELSSLIEIQKKDDADLEDSETKAEMLDTRRHELRRDLLLAEMEADQNARALESEKLSLLNVYFPSEQKSAQHLYSLVIAQQHCAVCGNEAKEAAAALSARVEHMQCVVCGSGLKEHVPEGNVVSFSKEKIAHLHQVLASGNARISSLTDELSGVANQYDSVASIVVDLRASMAERKKQIVRIEKALPPDDDAQERARKELTVLRRTLSGDKAELSTLAAQFRQQVDGYNVKIRQHSEAIKAAFTEYAEGFLAEEARLKWSPVKETLGETGLAKVEFPAFELEMSGSNFTAPTVRSGPDAVSESQREFIDLAFRMALIQVAGRGSGGSLVVDAPESSLDAYFVKRAADVLCRFGKPGSVNRLVVLSNLISGDLLPEMIKAGIPPSDASQRLVNLMDIAVPTAALRQNRAEYDDALVKIKVAGGLGA